MGNFLIIQQKTVFLGQTFGGYTCNFDGIATPTDVNAARHEIMSYAMLRLMEHRFSSSPGTAVIFTSIHDFISILWLR